MARSSQDSPAADPLTDAPLATPPAAPLAPARRWSRATLAIIGLALALLVALTLATLQGTVAIPPLTTLEVILRHIGLWRGAPAWPATDDLILMQVRLPRALGAALVGAALGVSGTLFQGLLRNPLADPLLLGTSSGAAFGAVVALILTSAVTVEWLGFSLVALLAFVGALLAVALVYGLATRGGRTPVVTLLLAGVVVSALLSAAQTLLIVLYTTLQQHFGVLYFWFSGAVSVQSWKQLAIVTGLLAVGLLAAFWLAPTLDAFALGEEMAGHLGVRVERRKLLIVGAASLLVAASVTLGGLVGFVGLLAPHACRLLLGPRNRPLVIASALGGAVFVTLADLLARTIVAPTELPLGVITAFVGGPFFLWLLRAAGQRYRW
ncbi:MAG TPA: iron ABC transporter permease [Ktedonobacterales bacterium]